MSVSMRESVLNEFVDNDCLAVSQKSHHAVMRCLANQDSCAQ